MSEQQCNAAYLDGLYPGGHASQQAKVNALWEVTLTVPACLAGSALPPFVRQEGVAPLPSILDKAFKGEL